jgi:hypothetical protein
MPRWRFDPRDVGNDYFEDELAALDPSFEPYIVVALDSLLDELETEWLAQENDDEDPFGPKNAVQAFSVRGEIVYIKLIAVGDPDTTPPLLFGYTLRPSERLVRKVKLARPSDLHAVRGSRSSNLEIYEALRRLLEFAVDRVRHHKDH